MDLDGPARDRKSIAHADEPAALGRYSDRSPGPSSLTSKRTSPASSQTSTAMRESGGTVLGGVLERFERREVDGRLDVLPVPLEPADLHPDAAIRASRLRQRGSEPEVAEDGRVCAVGDRPDLVAAPARAPTHLLELLVPPRRSLARSRWIRSATSCCCALSCRSRSIRRRSVALAVAIRRRDACSSERICRRSVSVRLRSKLSSTAVETASRSSGSSSSAAS